MHDPASVQSGRRMTAIFVRHPHGTQRAMRLVFETTAIGELAAGLALVVSPHSVAGLLLATPINNIAALLARIIGFAAATLGLTWWSSARDLDDQIVRMAPGFAVYNIGVGALILSWALTVTVGAIVPLVVGVLHLLAGLTLCTVFVLQRDTSHIRG
jgi:hypothetical protein